MPLDNSTIQHPLPGDLQARVENALNLVTSLEAEQNRLSKLIGSMKGDINSLHDEKKTLDSIIESTKKSGVDASFELANTILKLEHTQTAIKVATDDLDKLNSQCLEISNKIDADKKDNLERIKKVEDAEADINKRQAVLSEKESAHDAKVKRLLDALN